MNLLRVGLFLMLAAGAASAQALQNRDVEGVLFFKEHSFTDSSQGAWPIEYRSAASNDRIMVITTRDGEQLRFLAGQVPDVIPYPGRGGLSREEALHLCDIALARYPQHAVLLTNIRNAWAKVSVSDYEKYAQPSQARQGVVDGVISSMVSEAERVKNQAASIVQAPFVSLLDKQPTPAPSPQGTASASADKDAAPDNPELESLKNQLRELQEQ
jgi:hypothetical protein